MDIVLDIVVHESDCRPALYLLVLLSMIKSTTCTLPHALYKAMIVPWMMLLIWPFIANSETLRCRYVQERELCYSSYGVHESCKQCNNFIPFKVYNEKFRGATCLMASVNFSQLCEKENCKVKGIIIAIFWAETMQAHDLCLSKNCLWYPVTLWQW